jgi:hypothetical protein
MAFRRVRHRATTAADTGPVTRSSGLPGRHRAAMAQ